MSNIHLNHYLGFTTNIAFKMRRAGVFLLLFMCMFAAASVGIFGAMLAITHKANSQDIPPSQLFNMDVADAMLQSDYIEIEHEQTILKARMLKSQMPLNKGLVIFVPDANAGFGQSTSFTKLAQNLPAWGWTTLVMPSVTLDHSTLLSAQDDMPSQTPDQSSEQETASQTDTNEAPDSNDANAIDAASSQDEDENINAQQPRVAELHRQADFDSYPVASFEEFEKQLIAQVNSADTHMTNVLGRRIVVTQGLAAAVLARHYANTPNQSPDGFIVNNIYWPKHELNQAIPQWLAQTQMPVLDILSNADNRWSKQSAPHRKVAATVNLKSMYRQQSSYGVGGHEDELARLAKDIYGWVSYLGW